MVKDTPQLYPKDIHVDHPKELTHLSLCTGYGGIDLGLKRALRDVRTVAYVEIESFACENLVTKVEAGLLDAAPIWTDLKTLSWENFRGRVDILSSGFPCQPFSAAGRRAGDSDPRHLWPHITAGIRELGYPPIVFFENVEGIISSKLRGDGWADPAGTPVLLHVLRELERMGYTATAGVFSASEVGAPHQRKRVFILGRRADLSEAGRGIVDRLLRETERGQDVGSRSRWSVQSPCGRGRSEEGRAQEQDQESSTRGTGQDVAHSCDNSGRCSRASVHSDRRAVDGGGEGIPTERDAQDSHAQYASDAWPAPRGAEQYTWEPQRVTVGNADGKGLEGCRDAEAAEATKRRDAEIEHPGSAGSHERSELGDTDLTGSQGNVPTVEPGEREQVHTEPAARSGTRRDVQGQAEPALGGNSDGLTSGMGYAELCHAVDNRTDELRLLGNGVVPATAERAFRVLWAELRGGARA